MCKRPILFVISFSFLMILAGCNSSSSPTSDTPLNPLGEQTVHENITATLFWIGEASGEENAFIPNDVSAWDEDWQKHYGGVDTPVRTSLFPTTFQPHENPFYFALPYNDFNDDGTRKANAYEVIPWANEKKWEDNESMVKNHWIKIFDPEHNKTVYAQWEDAGPFVYDDTAYVFGDTKPQNKENDNAGLDLSPAVWIYLGYDTTQMQNSAKMNWQFVEEAKVPQGPWKDVVTTSQITWH